MSSRIKYFSFFLFLILVSSVAKGQRHRPYHSFGFSVSGNYGSMASNNYYNGPLGSNIYNYNVSPGLAFNFDYAPFSWLGLNTGLGLSIRGGDKSRGSNRFNYHSWERSDYWLFNLPLISQIKLGNFLWLETGLELNLQLGHNNEAPANYYSLGYSLQSTLKYPFLSYGGIGGMRFNLFRGLSIGLHLHRGLSPLSIEYPINLPYDKDQSLRLYDKSVHFSVRYMFNQAKFR